MEKAEGSSLGCMEYKKRLRAFAHTPTMTPAVSDKICANLLPSAQQFYQSRFGKPFGAP
jgi:hypothetical protein